MIRPDWWEFNQAKEALEMAADTSNEQKARDLLERMDIDDAQSMTAGDVVELANLFNEVARLQKKILLQLAYIQELQRAGDE